jgi:preprotein translocase SecE subunit
MEPKSHYSFGIYKYGQGYWVRMLTAIAVGILFISAAGWAWNELTKVTIPMPRWTMAVTDIEGKPAPGQSVTFLKGGNNAGTVGTGIIESAAPSGDRYQVVVGQLAIEPGEAMADTRQIQSIGADGVRAFYGVVGNPIGIRVFDLVYLQVGVATALVLTGFILIYHYVGRKPESVDFLIATDAEMRKVNWGTRKVILDSTWVVISATFLIAAVIFLSDTVLSTFFRAIGVLGTK